MLSVKGRKEMKVTGDMKGNLDSPGKLRVKMGHLRPSARTLPWRSMALPATELGRGIISELEL